MSNSTQQSAQENQLSGAGNGIRIIACARSRSRRQRTRIILPNACDQTGELHHTSLRCIYPAVTHPLMILKTKGCDARRLFIPWRHGARCEL